MKTSIIRISASVLKGIMEFRAKEKIQYKYALDCIGFGMDKSRGSKAVRYYAADGHIAITGICGEVEGHRLPKQGVSLPPAIYPRIVGIKGTEELTLHIDHSGSVTTISRRSETKVSFNPEDKHAPVLDAIPKEFGGTWAGSSEAIPQIILGCGLLERVTRGLKCILVDDPQAIRLTFFGEKAPIIFTSWPNFIAVQMPRAE